MNFTIPSTFIRSRARLTWCEVELGLQNRWLADQAVIDMAIDRVTAGDDSTDVVELASVLPDERDKVPEIARRLAERDRDCSKDKWLFLLLAWVYEKRDSVEEEPLAVVEELYADFGYPKEMASFVRYMPPQNPSRVGEVYLLDAWRSYLETAGRIYGLAVDKS